VESTRTPARSRRLLRGTRTGTLDRIWTSCTLRSRSRPTIRF
jgi:hypothetical protein